MTTPDPVQILQTLIRFDTTNPPGNEYLAIDWARETLAFGSQAIYQAMERF